MGMGKEGTGGTGLLLLRGREGKGWKVERRGEGNGNGEEKGGLCISKNNLKCAMESES